MEQEIDNLIQSLDELHISTEINEVVTVEEYDKLNNFKWESYEMETSS